MKTALLVTLGILLCSCASVRSASPAPGKPPPTGAASWALGEQPNFSGVIVDWAKGDAIAPGEGAIFATMYGTLVPDGEVIGNGSIKADASFKFGLNRGTDSANGSLPPAQVFCSGLKLSNPRQKIAYVGEMEVLSLYEEGVHARADGAIFVSVGKPLGAGMKALYTFFYAGQQGTLKGSCNIDGVGSMLIDLDLHKGWNSVRRDTRGFKTSPIPKTAKWYFYNTLTAGD